MVVVTERKEIEAFDETEEETGKTAGIRENVSLLDDEAAATAEADPEVGRVVVKTEVEETTAAPAPEVLEPALLAMAEILERTLLIPPTPVVLPTPPAPPTATTVVEGTEVTVGLSVAFAAMVVTTTAPPEVGHVSKMGLS